MTWQRGITDAGVANLRACEQLERVNLMGSPTGDGAIAALQGKPTLHYFSSGTTRHRRRPAAAAQFPAAEGVARRRTAEPRSHLLIDGPFTDDGLASLAGLEGVFDLDLFWHVTGITSGRLRAPGGLAQSRVAWRRRRS